MSFMAGLTLASPSAERRPAWSPWRETWRRYRRHKLAVVSAVLLLVLIVAVVFGPFVWRVSINDIDFNARLEGPSLAHPFGTDDLGQDILARMIYGGRRHHRHAGRRAGRDVARRARAWPDVADRPVPVAAATAAAAAADLFVPR